MGGDSARGLKVRWGQSRWNGSITSAPHVGAGFFPLDEWLGIAGESWSAGLKRVGTWLAVRTGSYQSAVEGLAENLRVEVSKTSLWRVVQEKGAVVKSRLDAEAQEQWGLPPQGQVVTGEVKQKTPMGIAVDGVYINLVEEGWKEVKVGAVFEVVPLSPTKQGGERRRQEQTEGRERVKAQAISYCATLGSVDEFEPVQWAEARSPASKSSGMTSRT